MSGRSLTEGSRRAVLLAECQASQWGHAEVLPAHLLWALLAEESHAFELLELAGVTRPAVEQADIWYGNTSPWTDSKAAVFGQTSHESQGRAEKLTGSDTLAALTRDVAAAFEQANMVEPLAESESLEQLHQRARLTAHLEGKDVETSSLHLLAAMLEVDQKISAFLFKCGLTTESFQPDPSQQLAQAEPIPVSFAIDQNAETPGERMTVFRILDASANRAREGLRVVEDFVRFSLNDAHLSALLKSVRHQLRAVMQDFDMASLIGSRDTRADVGTQISTPAELIRTDSLAVAKASLKRVQEATRTLEEYSKVLPAADGMSSKPTASKQQLEGRNVYLLLGSDQCEDDVEDVLREAIAGGVRIVQIREKTMADRELLLHARRIRRITRDTGALLIMNDRPDLAVLCEADGVHVGQDELSIHDVRRIVGPNCLIGVSTHSIEQARRAVLEGASCIGVGPVFQSGTKSFDEFAGLDFVREVAAEIQLPWFPIGGVDLTNVDEVVEAGASRIAVSGAICRAANPRQTAEQLVARLSNN